MDAEKQAAINLYVESNLSAEFCCHFLCLQVDFKFFSTSNYIHSADLCLTGPVKCRFLGHFRPQQGKPALWELDSDQHWNLGKSVHAFPDEDSRYFTFTDTFSH